MGQLSKRCTKYEGDHRPRDLTHTTQHLTVALRGGDIYKSIYTPAVLVRSSQSFVSAAFPRANRWRIRALYGWLTSCSLSN